MPQRPARSAPTLETVIETVAAAVFGALALLTFLVPQWIEAVFAVDPDAGSGTAEWLIVCGAAVAALSCAVPAARGWRGRTPIAQD